MSTRLTIGLQAPSSPAEVGGGFTFEWDLFRALTRAFDCERQPYIVCGLWECPPGVNEQIFVSLFKEIYSNDLIARGLRRIGRIARDAIRGILRLAGTVVSSSEPFEHSRLWASVMTRRGIQHLVHVSPHVLSVDIPFSVVVWDLEHRNAPYFPELSGDGEFERRERLYQTILPRAARIITGTNVGRLEISKFYGVPESRIIVLPHPTPGDALAAAEEDTPLAPPWMLSDVPVLLYPAQFWAHKNHVGLLNAVRVLRDSGVKCRLVCVGSNWGGNREYVEGEVRRLGLENDVAFPGFVPRHELLNAYRHAGCLTYASLCGPENLPPLEAFALGCPVVAASHDGAVEQLGDAAAIVDGTDDRAFAETIRAVLADQEFRSHLVARGKERAQRWTGDLFAAALINDLRAFSAVRRNWR